MKSVQKNNRRVNRAENRTECFVRAFSSFLARTQSSNCPARLHAARDKKTVDRLFALFPGIIRLLPSLTVVLIMTTLLIYLTVGPGAETSMIKPLTQVSEPPEAQQVLSDPFEWEADAYLQMNRGNYWDSWYLVKPTETTQQTEAVTIVETTDPTEPTVEITMTESQVTGQTTEPSIAEKTETTIEETTVFVQPTAAPEPTRPPEPTTNPLERDANGVVQEPLSPEAFEQTDETVYVLAYHANIRSAPRTDAALVAAVSMGDQLTRTGLGSYWSYISLTDGQTGYIYNDLISASFIAKPEPTPPPPEPTEPAQPTPVPEAIPPVDSSGLTDSQKQEMVALAKSMLGVPYVFAGSSPSGVDCSGFTLYIYKTLHGIVLPHKAAVQATLGTSISSSNITIGDILCFDWDRNGSCDHVGLYIGNGQYIHASSSKGKVVESTVNFSRNPILTIRRIIP